MDQEDTHDNEQIIDGSKPSHDQKSVFPLRMPLDNSHQASSGEEDGEEDDQITTENEARSANLDTSSTGAAAHRGTAGSFKPDPAFMDPATGLSMSTGAVRARHRRAREREEKERQREMEAARLKNTIKTPAIAKKPSTVSPAAFPSASSNAAAKAEVNSCLRVKESIKSARQLVYIGEGYRIENDNNCTSPSPLGARLNTLHQERQMHCMKAKLRSLEEKRVIKPEIPTPQCTPSGSIPASFSGPSCFIASKLPPSFPQEEAFRTISMYSTIRTFSVQLRVSPFTPTAFLYGLSCPFMTKLIGEIHVAILRLLFLNIGRGADFYRLASSSLLASSSKARQGSGIVDPDELMGSDCLTYMDAASWPLFYVDYVEATRHKFLELDVEAGDECPILKHLTPVPADPRSSVAYFKVKDYNYGNDDFMMEEEEQQQVAEVVPKTPLTSEEMKAALLDLLDKIARKADGYGFFSRPVDPVEDQCPDYFDVVDPIIDAMDLRTMNKLVNSGEIATLGELELYLKRIVTSSRKYNTDEENFVRKQTERFDSIAQGLVQRYKVSLGCITESECERPAAPSRGKEKPSAPISAPAFMRLRASRNITNSDRNAMRSSPRKSSSSAAEHESNIQGSQFHGNDFEKDHINDDWSKQSALKKQCSSLSPSSAAPLKRKCQDISSSPPRSGSQQLVHSMIGTKKRNVQPLKISMETIAAHNEIFALISNSSHSNRESYDDDPKIAESADDDPETIKEVADIKLTPAAAGLRENNAVQQGGARRSNRTRIRTGGTMSTGSAFDSICHVQAARQIEDFTGTGLDGRKYSSCYGALPVTAKLDVLEFLLDEFIQLDLIEAELTRRYHNTQYFQPLEYVPLPKKDDLEKLSNVDDCVLCNYPGDLVCCDGCTNSFHKRCCTYVDASLNRQNSQNSSVVEEKWLCPECRIPDSSKLGNLLGGKKSSLCWWKKEDLDYTLKFFKQPLAEDGMPTTAQSPVITDVDTSRDTKPTFESDEELCPAISSGFLSDKEYLIVHGFVFQRSISRDAEPLLLNQVQLFDVLRQLGPIVCSDWPWCQIPSNPIEIWPELANPSTDEVKAPVHKLQLAQKCYLSTAASYNPTLYINVYAKAPPPPVFLQYQPIPKHLYQAASPTEQFVANYDQLVSSCLSAGIIEDEHSLENYAKVKLPILSAVTCDTYNDPLLLTSGKLQSWTDPLAPAKDYLILLEKVLFRACLLHESWGLAWNKCRDRCIASVFSYKGSKKRTHTNTKRLSTFENSAINSSWGLRLINARTVTQVSKCAVLLVDAVDTKAFHEEWNKIPQKGSTLCFLDNETVTARPNLDLPEHWTIESVLLKRKWERSSDLKEGRRLLIGEATRASEFVPSIGRKGQNAKYRGRSIQLSSTFTGHESKHLNSCNFSDSINSGPRRGRPPKLHHRGTQTKKSMVTKYYFKCIHCMEILPHSLTTNGPQHATRDFFNHLQGCHRCPEVIKDLIASLRSQKIKSVDGPSFFKLLTHRACECLNSNKAVISNGSLCNLPRIKDEASDSKTTFDNAHFVDTDQRVVDTTGPRIKSKETFMPLECASFAAPTNMGEEGSASKGRPQSDHVATPNIADSGGLTPNQCANSGLKQGSESNFAADDALVHDAASEKLLVLEKEISVEESNEENVYSFAPNKYVLVDSTDSHLASRYLVALFKHFLPSSMTSSPLKELGGADIISFDRPTFIAPKMRGHRLVSDRYYVACVHCGYIPPLGIKVGGPQHTTKDLYYHLCDCERCPDYVKAPISKLRSKGLKSHDSGKFFKMQMARLAQHVNSRSIAELRDELVENMSKRDQNSETPADQTSDKCIYEFNDSTYPLVKKEDELIGSLYFAALYKHFWPVGKNFGDKKGHESEVSLVLSASQKRMVWQISSKATDDGADAETKTDVGKQQLPIIDEEFHPDEETIILVPEVVGEGDLDNSEGINTSLYAGMSNENSYHSANIDEDTADIDLKTSEVEDKPFAEDCSAKSASLLAGALEAGSYHDENMKTPNDHYSYIETKTEELYAKTEVNACATSVTSPDLLKIAAASEAINCNNEDSDLCKASVDAVGNDQTTCAQENDGGDEIQEDMSEWDQNFSRKGGRAVRRSGRVQLRSVVLDEIGSYAELPVPAAEKVQHLVTNSAEVEAMQKVRNARIANIEKLLVEPLEKEIFWPICGRLYIPPTGCLSPAIMRYLVRNAGSKPAPFMFYSDKLEVGKPSVRQRWRTNTLACETIEELHLQLQILEQHLNRMTISSGEFIARKTSMKSSVLKVYCSHRDTATGMIEYFVVSSSKNRGSWLPEDAVDLQAFVLMKRERIEQTRRKFESIVNKISHEKYRSQERTAIEAVVLRSSPKETGSAVISDCKRGSAVKNVIRIANGNFSQPTNISNPPIVSDAVLFKVEEQLVKKLQNILSKHQADTCDLFDRAFNSSALAVSVEEMNNLRQSNRKLMDSVNASLQQYGSKMCIPEELIDTKMREAELSAKRKVAEERRIKQANKEYTGRPSSSNEQVLSDLEIAFEKAYMQHQLDTKNMLAAASDAGLKTVPEDSMNAVRSKNLRLMQSANMALHNVGSPKALTEPELIQKLKNCEAMALQWHITEERRKHPELAAAPSAAPPPPPQHTIPPANRVAQQHGYYPLSNSNFTADVAARSRQQQQQHQQTYQAFVSNNYHPMTQMNRPMSQSIPQSMPQQSPQQSDYQAREAHSTLSAATGQMFPCDQHHPQNLPHHVFQNNNTMHHLNLAPNNVAGVVNRQNHFVAANQNLGQQQMHFQTMQAQQQGMIGQSVSMLQQQQPNRQQYNMLQNPSPMQQQPHEFSAPSTGQNFNLSDSMWNT